jgi:hypothetical protein
LIREKEGIENEEVSNRKKVITNGTKQKKFEYG